MNLLITSINNLSDFVAFTGMEKQENFTYLDENTIVIFINYNLFDQIKYNKNDRKISLNEILNYEPKFLGYNIKMIQYKKMLDFINLYKNRIEKVKIDIPNDPIFIFNAEIIMHQFDFKIAELKFDNSYGRKTEEEIINKLNFDEYVPNFNFGTYFYKYLLFFLFRFDISFFIKKIYLQKTDIDIKSLNIDILMISELLKDNININLNKGGKLLLRLPFYEGIEKTDNGSFNITPTYHNIHLFLKLNLDKEKLYLSDNKKFFKFQNKYIKEIDNKYYISNENEEFSSINGLETDYIRINDIVFLLFKFNSINNIVWNIRQLETLFEFDENFQIIKIRSELKEIIQSIKDISPISYMEDFLNNIQNKSIKNKSDFDQFLKNDYKRMFFNVINDFNLKINNNQKPISICPVCKKGNVFSNEYTYFCHNCNFSLFKNCLNYFGVKTITRSDFKKIIDKGFIYYKIKKRNKKDIKLKFVLNKLNENNVFNLTIYKKRKEL